MGFLHDILQGVHDNKNISCQYDYWVFFKVSNMVYTVTRISAVNMIYGYSSWYLTGHDWCKWSVRYQLLMGILLKIKKQWGTGRMMTNFLRNFLRIFYFVMHVLLKKKWGDSRYHSSSAGYKNI